MATKNARATQEFVPIKEIRDGFVVLKDGGMRAVLLSSALNFALKSEENQNAIILQFQNFLNSLDFSLQIFIESRRLDIRPYLALLEARLKAQTTELMRIQVREYMGFIKNFTDTVSIMSKSFFVVVPYSPALLQKKGGVRNILPRKDAEEAEKKRAEAFEEERSQLEQRISVVEQGLVRCGLRTVRLGTEEVVELFYKLFNPGETEKPIQTT